MNSNGVITAPVSFTDVKTVLLSLDNDLSKLVPRANVNKWNKYKPVSIDSTYRGAVDIVNGLINVVNPFTNSNQSVPGYWGDCSHTTENISFSGNDSGHVELYNVMGINIPVVNLITVDSTNLNKYVDALSTNSSINWGYRKPTGGITSPYRLGDFRNYDHGTSCPISYSGPTEIYEGQSATVYCDYVVENLYQFDLQELGDFFNGYSTYVVVYKNGTNIGSYEIGPIYQGIDHSVSLPISNSAGTYKIYFVAMKPYTKDSSGNKTYPEEKVLLLPTLPDNPNPMTIVVKEGLDPDDPNTNPSGQMSWGAVGFSYSNSQSYFETYDNVGEGDYVEFATRKSIAFKFTVSRPSSSTSPAKIYLDVNKFLARWTGWSKSTKGYSVPYINVYVDGTLAATNGLILFNPGDTKTIIVVCDDIYYDTENSTSYTPSSSGESWPSYDSLFSVYYDVNELLWVEIPIIYPSSQYNGVYWYFIDGGGTKYHSK